MPRRICFLLSTFAVLITIAVFAKYHPFKTEFFKQNFLKETFKKPKRTHSISLHISKPQKSTYRGVISKTNKTFAKGPNFPNAKFMDTVNFGGDKILKYADFSSDTFFKVSYFPKILFKDAADFSNTVFRESSDFSQTVFQGPADFTNLKVKDSVDFSNTTFKKFADFQLDSLSKITFYQTRFFNGVDFTSDKFGSSSFVQMQVLKKRSLFDSCNFRKFTAFDESYFKEEVDFGSSTFKNSVNFNSTKFDKLAYFNRCEFIGITDFSDCEIGADIDFSDADFSQARTLNLSHLKFKTDSAEIVFDGAVFPDTILFSDNNNIKNNLYFTTADLNSVGDASSNDAEKKYIFLYLFNTDLTKLHFDYIHFRLFLPDFTRSTDSTDKPQKILLDQKMAVYEAALANFKSNGQTESYKRLDMEYQDFKWEHSWRVIIRYLPLIWWNYGYDKELVFAWIIFLMAVFTAINYIFIFHLARNVYPLDNERPKLIWRIKCSTTDLRARLWYAFIFTARIFFAFTLKTENFKFKEKGSLYLIFIFLLGLLCMAYTANFIIEK